jgi:hypothetical protein
LRADFYIMLTFNYLFLKIDPLMNFVVLKDVARGFSDYSFLQDELDKGAVIAAGGRANLNAVEHASLMVSLVERIGELSKGKFFIYTGWKNYFYVRVPTLFYFHVSQRVLNFLSNKTGCSIFNKVFQANLYVHKHLRVVLLMCLIAVSSVKAYWENGVYTVTVIGAFLLSSLLSRLSFLDLGWIKKMEPLLVLWNFISSIGFTVGLIVFGHPLQKVEGLWILLDFLWRIYLKFFSDEKFCEYNDKRGYLFISTIEEFLASCALNPSVFEVNRQHVWVNGFCSTDSNFDCLLKFIQEYRWSDGFASVIRKELTAEREFDGIMAAASLDSDEDLKQQTITTCRNVINAVTHEDQTLGGRGIDYGSLKVELSIIQRLLPKASPLTQETVIKNLGLLAKERCMLGVATFISQSVHCLIVDPNIQSIDFGFLKKENSLLPCLIFHHLMAQRKEIIESLHYILQTPSGIKSLNMGIFGRFAAGFHEMTGLYQTPHGLNIMMTFFGYNFGVMRHEDITGPDNNLFLWFLRKFYGLSMDLYQATILRGDGIKIDGYDTNRIVEIAYRVMNTTPVGISNSLRWLRKWSRDSGSDAMVKRAFSDFLSDADFLECFIDTKDNRVKKSFVCAVLYTIGVLQIKAADQKKLKEGASLWRRYLLS